MLLELVDNNDIWLTLEIPEPELEVRGMTFWLDLTETATVEVRKYFD